MSKLLRYILLTLFCCQSVVFVSANDEGNTLKDYKGGVIEEAISIFHNSLGFDYITKEEYDSLNVDSVLAVLESSQQYKTYFCLERVLIRSFLFRGRIRIAIAQSDKMYSKARALSDPFGTALALNAMGEVYTYTNKLTEAGAAYERALELLYQMKGEDIHIRTILVGLVDHNICIQNKSAAAYFISLLNNYPESQLSIQEQAVRHLFNAYYQLFKGDISSARTYLDKLEQMKDFLVPSIRQFFLIIHARYLKASGENERALAEYDEFLKTEYARNNHNLYKKTLQEKANLLLKMGDKEKAYVQYGEVLEYINSSFEKNYPKEIDLLSSRFQADHLAYQNERDSLISKQIYMVGVIVCALFLILFIILSWKKIFRLRNSQQRKEAMKRQAEQAILRKNVFLSNMSHEVRTPLNAIVGFSVLLASDGENFDDESRKEFCDIIKVNSAQLLKLINDILDFSDFENDNTTFHIKTYDVVKLCHETIETVVASRKLQVKIRFETDFKKLMVETDDARLRQVLINLLVNATKFTEDGTILLSLGLIDENTALFTVTDTGCGIPFEKQQLIFERFEKLDDFAQGTGLGLSICRLILKYMNGKIWVDSEYRQGARFCFSHPLKHYAGTPKDIVS